jgi:two-component system, sensor histidine kinase RegB
VRTSDEVNLSWLVTLRWGAVAGQLALVAGAQALWSLRIPLVPVAVILALEVSTNLVARSRRFYAPVVLRVLMVLDVVLFTVLLAFTGGPSNPFSFLSLIYIALAAVILPPQWTWLLALLSVAGYGVLFWVAPQVDHEQLMQMHLRGMWLAYGVAAFFIVYFVHRVATALVEREAQLRESRARIERTQRLAALATLAAGAAHDLSTPLSTIAVIAKDLVVAPGAEGDVLLIREQVARCAQLLRHMAADVGATHGERPEAVPLTKLIEAATVALPGAERIEASSVAQLAVTGPPRALAQALRSLMSNALQASSSAVQVQVHQGPVENVIEVRDSGPGMTQETLHRAGEPFFTTKAPGAGTGLGLFLARAVLEQLHGRLELVSAPGQGTRARMVLPRSDFQATGVSA